MVNPVSTSPGWLALLAALATAPLAAQSTDPPGWVFRTEDQADLWFHGLALVGFEGFSPLPMYDRAYADAVAADKLAQGVAPTDLDRSAVELRKGLEQDSTFEVFHFVPLYVAGEPPQALFRMADAIRSSPPRSAGFAAAALRRVLTAESHVRQLDAFTTALEDEWDEYARAGFARTGKSRRDLVRQAQSWWDRELAQPLAGFLRGAGLTSGTVLASPALGAEGRIFQGPPNRGNVVAVTLNLHGAPADIALAALREMCFPLVSPLVERMQLAPGNRWAAERISSRAAVRCGRLVLARYAPDHAGIYETMWLTRAQSPGAVFEAVFDIDPRLLDAIGVSLGTRR